MSGSGSEQTVGASVSVVDQGPTSYHQGIAGPKVVPKASARARVKAGLGLRVRIEA